MTKLLRLSGPFNRLESMLYRVSNLSPAPYLLCACVMSWSRGFSYLWDSGSRGEVGCESESRRTSCDELFKYFNLLNEVSCGTFPSSWPGKLWPATELQRRFFNDLWGGLFNAWKFTMKGYKNLALSLINWLTKFKQIYELSSLLFHALMVLSKCGNLYQSFTTLGLDPVSSGQ